MMISEKLEWDNIVEQVCKGHEQRSHILYAVICPVCLYGTWSEGQEIKVNFLLSLTKLTDDLLIFVQLTYLTVLIRSLWIKVWPVNLMSHLYTNELPNVHVATKVTVTRQFGITKYISATDNGKHWT